MCEKIKAENLNGRHRLNQRTVKTGMLLVKELNSWLENLKQS